MINFSSLKTGPRCWALVKEITVLPSRGSWSHQWLLAVCLGPVPAALQELLHDKNPQGHPRMSSCHCLYFIDENTEIRKCTYPTSGGTAKQQLGSAGPPSSFHAALRCKQLFNTQPRLFRSFGQFSYQLPSCDVEIPNDIAETQEPPGESWFSCRACTRVDLKGQVSAGHRIPTRHSPRLPRVKEAH